MVDTFVTKKPRFIEEDYKKRYKEPYKCVEGSLKSTGSVFKGTGAVWEDHPLRGYIPKYATECGKCKTDKTTKIIMAHWVVNIHSGDAYWDCEMFCENCKLYTQNSYAEND